MNACIKCGNVDEKNKISTAYHKNECSCWWKSNSTKESEHLHFICQVCGYDWCTPCVGPCVGPMIGPRVDLSVGKKKKARK